MNSLIAAAARDQDLEAAVAAIRPAVDAALAAGTADDLLEAAVELYGSLGGTDFEAFTTDIGAAVAMTEPDGTEQQAARISNWLATAALNASVFYSGTFEGKTWVTMQDDAVRPSHAALHGVTTDFTGTFDVNGTPTRYPGEPVGPPENWINCRCRLSVALLAAAALPDDDFDFEDDPPAPNELIVPDDDAPMYWHAVMTLEDAASGDRRRFDRGAIEWDDVPLPFEWQRVTAPEHQGAHTVGAIRGMARVDTQIRSWGTFLDNDEADELIGVVSEGAVRGVSPSIDKWVESDLALQDEGGRPIVSLAKARVRSGTVVNIPAFAEAYLRLGPPPPGFMGEDVVDEARDDVDDGLAAAGDPPRGVVVVARPAGREALAVDGGLPPEELHITLGYYGHAEDAPDGLREKLEGWIAEAGDVSFTARVGGVASMGDDQPQAVAYLLEAAELNDLRAGLEAVAAPDQTHPHFTPHMTIGYGSESLGAFDRPATIDVEGVELWWAGERIGGVTAGAVHFRERNAEQRRALAKKGWAMPDGSYPIADLEDLRNAIQAIGRAKDPAAVKRHIRKRARALGHSELIPDTWAAGDVEEMSGDAQDFARGAGWVTHPRETSRLHRYWTRGPGAAKIRWGMPHDFYRCRRQLRKYISPAYLNRTCAQWHHDALGYWPGEHKGDRSMSASAHTHTVSTPAGAHTHPVTALTGDHQDEPMPIAIVAGGCDIVPLPGEWFHNPRFSGPTPVHIGEPNADGFRPYRAHLATWGTCHISFSGKCIEPPHSRADYAFFRTGIVQTTEGDVPVGIISMDTNHAARDLAASATVAHYEHTGTQAAWVASGEDEYGIWVAGALVPMPEAQVAALTASAPSGDWRWIRGNLELVAALAVNVPGFPVPRVSLAASGDKVTSLVAAGVVLPPSAAPGGVDIDAHLDAALERRDQRRARAARVAAVHEKARAERLAALVASGELE